MQILVKTGLGLAIGKTGQLATKGWEDENAALDFVGHAGEFYAGKRLATIWHDLQGFTGAGWRIEG